MREFLASQGVAPTILRRVDEYRQLYGTDAAPLVLKYRYLGREIWETALAALLAGENLLLTGPRATGKNVLAENLAAVLGRPLWNISLHLNTDAASLLGTDTFKDGEVRFQPGPLWDCSKQGGVAVLDEINMARSEALAAIHPLLDYRRTLTPPGEEPLAAHPATRVIATMNYGYEGTRELNEALLSRFMILPMPEISPPQLKELLISTYPTLQEKIRQGLINFFSALQEKSRRGEISDRPTDLRGLLGALKVMREGLSLKAALRLGLVNKSQLAEERTLTEDILTLYFPEDMTSAECFA